MAGVGIVVIALALVLGAFRLLIGQLPGYQNELRAWVATELGVDAQFAELDARLGLFGPELELRDATLRLAASDRQFLDARRASITVDPWSLLLGGRVAIARLTLDGARLTIERTAEGELRIQGLESLSTLDGGLAALFPPTIDVVVRDSGIIYVDIGSGESWQLTDLNVALGRSPGALTARVTATPPQELAARAEATLSQRDGDESAMLEIEVSLSAADLAALGGFSPDPRFAALGGTGDLDLSVDLSAGRPVRVRLAAELTDVSVGDSDSNSAGGGSAVGGDGAGSGNGEYSRLAFDAEWQRMGETAFEVSISRLEVSRGGRDWPADATAWLGMDDASGRLELRADFLRLEDLTPVAGRWLPAPAAEQWLALEPAGDLARLAVSAVTGAEEPRFSLEGAFTDLALASYGRVPGFSGLSGEVRAGDDAGTIRFDSERVSMDWPDLLDVPLEGGSLRGTVLWRQGVEGLRAVSNDLELELFDEPLTASFDLELPDDDSGPYLDAHARLAAIPVATAKTLLPYRIMPSGAANWLRAALGDGIARNVEFEFVGPVRAFPFEAGDGRFFVEADVADASLQYVADWPPAQALNGRIRFENAGFSAAGEGRVLGSATESLTVSIGDMRSPLLEVDATAAGPLGDVLEYVQTAPLLSRHLGPGFDRVGAISGSAVTELDLDLPLRDFSSFELASRLTIDAGTLGIDGFAAQATEISGVLDIRNSRVESGPIEAVFLGGPATATVRPAGVDGYRTVLEVQGETTSAAVLDTFSLPFEDLLEGQTRWSGQLFLPPTEVPDAGPLRISVESNLEGIAVRFPDPIAKSPGEPMNLQLVFTFDSTESLAIVGNLGATRRFDFELDRESESYRVRRGAITFGGETPVLPLRDGIVVSGRVPQMRLDDWLELGRSSSIDRARPLFYSASLDVAEFEAYGQMLGTTSLDVRRGDRIWDVEIDSAAIAGSIEVPQDLSFRTPIIADMDRVYLALNAESADMSDIDPGRLPGLRLRSTEFGFSSRELGRIEADIVADPQGLRLASFSSSTDSSTIEASGSWLRDAGGTTSRIAAKITSVDVAASLEQLGIGSIVEAESGELTADIYWNGPPAADWLDHLNGQVDLHVETGSLIDVEPGAGRVVGLMSIATLPRRLNLDFRDVFNKGLAFDEINGGFSIIDGDAYTDDLMLSGVAAEIGVIGRTGLRDRDYQQQAVVTAEPSKMLPAVGGLLGGPGVGAALLIFTQIFKKPLKGIGRVSYCVTGSWDEPVVERVTPDRADEVEQCVALPEAIADTVDGG